MRVQAASRDVSHVFLAGMLLRSFELRPFGERILAATSDSRTHHANPGHGSPQMFLTTRAEFSSMIFLCVLVRLEAREVASTRGVKCLASSVALLAEQVRLRQLQLQVQSRKVHTNPSQVLEDDDNGFGTVLEGWLAMRGPL